MSFFDSNFIRPMSFQASPLIKANKQIFFDDFIERFPVANPSGDKQSFKNIFRTAVQDVIDTDRDYTNKQYLLATGQMDNAADVTVAGAKAQLAVDLLVQLRNSALTAYNEILRINV